MTTRHAPFRRRPHMPAPLPLQGKRTAEYSECKTFRYKLDVVWDSTLPLAAFIGVHPLKVSEDYDDPFLRACYEFADRWGCGGMRLVNLFAFRTAGMHWLKLAADPVGPDNGLTHLLMGVTGPRVAAWGTNGKYLERGAAVEKAVGGLQCLGRNPDGTPKHAIFAPKAAELVRFSDWGWA